MTPEGEAELLAEQLALPGIDAVVPFSVPLTSRFRGITERHGLLLHGASGWGEWAPFDEYDDEVAARWLAAAIEAASVPAPPPRRGRVMVNVTVPAVGPIEARALVRASGCTTAKVKVAEVGQTLADDVARVAAVRSALGPAGRIRVDANAAWSVVEALAAIPALEEAAGGLEYAEQPCAGLQALAEVRARTGVRIAADESIRLDRATPSLVRDAVDVAVVKVHPSGGVAAALSYSSGLGLPVVVSSAIDTSVGLAAGVRLAAALPASEHACGLGTGLLLGDDVVVRPLRPAGGGLDVAAAADLVLRPDVPSPSAERVGWLVARIRRASAVAAREQGA